MKELFTELLTNESGVILSAEMVLILTIAVLGVVVGLSEITTAVVVEFQDLAWAFYSLNQSFATPQFLGCFKIFGRTSFSGGSVFFNNFNGCVGPGAVGVGGFGGGGFGGGGFGGGYGGFGGGYGGYGGGYSGGYAEIGCGTQCVNSALTAPAPCENCSKGMTTPSTPSPTPEPPPAAK